MGVLNIKYAAVAAINGDQSCLIPMLKAFNERHDYVVKALNEIEGVDCLPSDGTFYSFPNIQGLIDRLEGISNDADFAEHLLDKTGVALVPGSAFGLEGHIRISYATSMENREKSIERIASL